MRKLSGEIPATFVAFDLLLWDKKKVHTKPIEERRAELERVGDGFSLSPVSDDVAQGRDWLETLQAAGFDGVIAKKLGLPYLPGSRDGVVKIKPHKTADCVVVGLRWKAGGRSTIATLLLGLYNDDGHLDYVGSCAVGAKKHDEIAALVLPLLDEKNDRVFSEPNRWGTGDLEQVALQPKLVAEVRYDKLEKARFRHGTRLIRFRPDKDPDQCTWREVRPPPQADRPDGHSASFLALLGCTRFGSPGIFGKFGGYGASPSPSASSRSTHSSRTRRSHTAASMPACRSPSSAKRGGSDAIVKSSVSTSGSSSHDTGADTVASGRPRTEYAERIVRSRAFWL